MSQSELDLIAALRRELEATREELRRAEAFIARMQGALGWYLLEDRRAVEEGTIETVAMRPAFLALGGRAAPCRRHRNPSTTCLTCYPSPPRPRVAIVARA